MFIVLMFFNHIHKKIFLFNIFHFNHSILYFYTFKIKMFDKFIIYQSYIFCQKHLFVLYKNQSNSSCKMKINK